MPSNWIDPPGPANRFLVLPAVFGDPLQRHGAVGNVDILPWDVHMVEQMLVHPAVIALQPVGGQSVVFVEIEGHHPRQIEPFIAVHTDQFAVDAHRGRSGSQPQDGLLAKRIPLADRIGDHPRDMPRHVDVGAKRVAGDLRTGDEMGG